MAYLPRPFVDKNIKKKTMIGKDGEKHVYYEAYVGVDPFSHKPRRISRSTKFALGVELTRFYAVHRVGGDAAVRLTAMQALDAYNAYDALASAGIHISLFDVVNDYINGTMPKQSSIPDKKVKDAFMEYCSTKEGSADLANINYRTGRWVGTLGDKLLGDIATKDVYDYVDAEFGKLKPKTYNSHLLYIKTFLNWCVKEPRAYLEKNPAAVLEPKPEPWEEPKYMAAADVKMLFSALDKAKDTRPDLLAYAIVSFFCGCRAVEIIRMATDKDAARVDIESETIRISKAKGYQQGKRPRAFHIHPTALAWMKSFDFLSALKKITPNIQIDLYKFARDNGIPVFKNCGRHTFITYHVATYGDPLRTTAMVGTSDKMRADNYCGLASRMEGIEYFNTLPNGLVFSATA